MRLGGIRGANTHGPHDTFTQFAVPLPLAVLPPPSITPGSTKNWVSEHTMSLSSTVVVVIVSQQATCVAPAGVALARSAATVKRPTAA